MRKPFHQDFLLSQTFGNKFFYNGVDVYAQYGMKGHNGLDYALPTGTDILAPHSGKIIEVADEGNIGYGKYVKIENDKEGSVLAHLKDVLITVGSTVSEGQLIAHSNNSGNSTGPHLHWGYYTFPRNRQNGYAGFIDQLPLLKPTAPAPSVDLQKELDKVRAERDKNWNLYQETLEQLKKEKDKSLELQRKVNLLIKYEQALKQVQSIINFL